MTRAAESRRQADLFAAFEERPPLFGYTLPEEVLAYRRPQAEAMLKMAREARVFPWRDLTVATCEEMRFNAMARLFPPAEGRALLEAFAVEITRLYALIGEPWTPLYEGVLKRQYQD